MTFWGRLCSLAAFVASSAFQANGADPIVRVVQGAAQAPVSVTTNKAGNLLFDFGVHQVGWLEVNVAEKGPYAFVWGELLDASGSVQTNAFYTETEGNVRCACTCGTFDSVGWMRIPYCPGENATVLYTNTVDRIGPVMPFRWLEVVRSPFTIGAKDVRQVPIYYPYDMSEESFFCDSPELVRVHDFCKHTIRATSYTGKFIDGDRERIAYEGDSFITLLSTLAMTSDYTLSRASVDYLATHTTWPTEWKQFFVRMVYEDWRYTGCTNLVSRHYDLMKNVKSWRHLRRADGLIVTPGEKMVPSPDGGTHQDIVDWGLGYRDGFVFRPVNAVVNALHYRNLRELAEMARALGKADDATEFDREAGQTFDAYQAVFYSPSTGCYCDGEGTDHETVQANAMALACGLVPQVKVRTVADFITFKGFSCGTYMAQFVLDALYAAGRDDAAFELMTSSSHRSWLGMMAKGATMTMEFWDLTLSEPWRVPDMNHAWSTSPLNTISRRLLGVTPLEPGFAKVSIRPQPGPLKRLSGVVPTVKGGIRLEMACGDGWWTVVLDSPAPVEFEFRGCRRSVAAGRCAFRVADKDANEVTWPLVTREMKPWVYNWWMASAVDEAGIEAQCRELENKGFGGFHVIPIYGAKGYEDKACPFLSTEWIERWNLAARRAREHDLGIDLTMGAGWCFGGPWVTPELGASSGMRVKRAGPGGEGLMIDPFSVVAMTNHLAQFDRWFGKGGTAERPRAFYHDSYEYYEARPREGADPSSAQRSCFKAWTDWCRENGYLTRNEGHGAPTNWLDLYALADIPETEMFGDDCRDILISKFASSAAHIKGTKLISAEACTWIDENFREKPSEIKSFLDRLFLSGVNHVFYHGCCYSPVDAVWPGWCYYASCQMNPRNPIWREMASLNAYVTRCQSLFQTWTPDNDLALVWDPWNDDREMTVHKTDWFYGHPIGQLASRLAADGYCFDYVSPQMQKTLDLSKYVEILDPLETKGPEKARKMPFDVRTGLLATRWRKDDETAFFVVNTGQVARLVRSDRSFWALDPLTGSRRQTTSLRLEGGHSAFVVGKSFEVGEARIESCKTMMLAGPWRVSGVCGGPALPAERIVSKLEGWQTWDDAFSGTMSYKTTFACPDSEDMKTLSLGDVREIARVRLNGVTLGVRFLSPYELPVPDGIVKAKGNVLEVEVTNLGANRIRWNDRTGVDWKYFTDANVVTRDYKPFDASWWKPLASGLLGPVELKSSERPLETAALQARIDALAEKGGGVLTVLPGIHRTGALFFKSGVGLHLERGAILLGSDEAEDYPMTETRIEGETCTFYPALINADQCNGFSITGAGVIDGHGLPTWRAFWALRERQPDCPNKALGLVRPRVLYVSRSRDVEVSGVTFRNAKFWTTHFYRCENTRVRDCTIVAETLDGVRGPSTDAIDIDNCCGFTVSNVVMDVNDDAVVVKGGKGPWADDGRRHPENGPSESVVIEDCTFRSACHSCLTLGSECPAATNVVMRNCRLEDPGNLLHLKMRTDTPQHFAHIRIENCRGTCGPLLRARAYTQFHKDGGRPRSSLKSYADDILFKDNEIVCREEDDVVRDETVFVLTNLRYEGKRPEVISFH